MAFPRAGVSSNHESLLTLYEVHLCNLQHLSFIQSTLERKVEVGHELSLRQP